MIDGAVSLAVGDVEGVAFLHQLPTTVVLNVADRTVVALKAKVEEYLSVFAELTDVKRHEIVGLACCEAHLNGLHGVTVLDDFNGGLVFLLFHGQQDVALLSIHTHHGVLVGEDMAFEPLLVLGQEAAHAHEQGSQED